MCNKFVKFDLFVKEADKLGCDFVATGHYARVENGKILMGSDPNKDQTYFLWAIPPGVLPRVLFPVGGMIKSEVREKARELELSVADKKDSVGICFVGEVNMKEFLKEKIADKPGEIVTTEGKSIGRHDGVMFYTIGQREGMGIGGGTPYYVVGKDIEKNQLVVSSNFHPSLFRSELTAFQANWFRKPEIGKKIQARIRYRQPVADCEITRMENDRVHVRFHEPQRAVTPGQSIVFYDGEEMLGGAIIE
jgi:tRNA-specific 2-thiouridylase